MWESSGSSECANSISWVASDGSGQRCHQGQVIFQRRWSTRCQAKQHCISPRACEHFGERRGRGGGEASAARHEPGTDGQKSGTHGVSVAKLLALAQADIWAKCGEAGDVYELEALLKPMEVTTLSSIERLVGEVGNAGHLLVTHRNGMRCWACNTYRARRQFKNLSESPCVPRPSLKDIIVSFRTEKRQHGTAFSPHLAADLSARRTQEFVSAVSTPVSIEKQTITEHDHGADSRADWTTSNSPIWDVDGGSTQPPGELDASVARPQSNL